MFAGDDDTVKYRKVKIREKCIHPADKDPKCRTCPDHPANAGFNPGDEI